MKKGILCTIITALCCCCILARAENGTGLQRKSIQVGGLEREYLVYVPKNYNAGNTTGILVCLHGINRGMYDFFNSLNITPVADALNLVVIAPKALPEQDPEVITKVKSFSIPLDLDSVWGAGLVVKASSSQIFPPIVITPLEVELNKDVDDVAFIHQVIQETKRDYDKSKDGDLFLLGTSMGGYMSYQYARTYGNNLAGMVVIAGTEGSNIDDFQTTVQVPLCDFHSESDEVVPYAGSYLTPIEYSSKTYDFTVTLGTPKETVITNWVARNNAAETPVVTNFPDANSISVSKYTYAAVRNEVIHYKMKGVSHNYYLSKQNGDPMDFNEEIYAFLSTHLSSGSSIKNPSIQNLTFYPNPAHDMVRFDLPQGKVNISDLNGRLVLSGEIKLQSFNVSSLAKGLYFIRVDAGEKVWTGKLIKN